MLVLLSVVSVVLFSSCKQTPNNEDITDVTELIGNPIELGELQKQEGYVIAEPISDYVTVRNCNNPNQRNDKLREAKTTERNIEWSIGIEVGGEVEASVKAVAGRIIGSIESGYQLEVGEQLERSRELDLPVDPFSSGVYVIEWKPVIWNGYIPFKHQTGESIIEYQYTRYLFGEVLDFIDKTAEECDRSVTPTVFSDELSPPESPTIETATITAGDKPSLIPTKSANPKPTPSNEQTNGNLLPNGEPISSQNLANLVGGNSNSWTKRGPTVWGYWDEGNSVTFRHPGGDTVLTEPCTCF